MNRDIIYLIVIACLLGLGFFFYDRWQKLREVNQQKDSIIAEQNDTIRHRINQFGKVVAEKLAAQATARQLAEAYPQLEKELKDEFDIKIRDLKSYIRNEITARGQGQASVTNNYYIDSLGNKIATRDLRFNDGYLDFRSTIDSTSLANSVYIYTDTIVTAIHSKKKWFLGSEKLFASSMLKNPNARVSASTNLLVDDYRDKRFVIYVGAGYDPFNNRPVISAGIGYAIFKF